MLTEQHVTDQELEEKARELAALLNSLPLPPLATKSSPSRNVAPTGLGDDGPGRAPRS